MNPSRWTVIAIVLGGIFCGLLVGGFMGFTNDLPQIRSLESFTPSMVTRIYSSDGVLLAELFVEKRDPVPLDQIPDHLKSALIATEDRKFYSHSGVDIRAVFRAIIKDIMAGEFVEGASTITQQLAKTLFLTPRKTLVRKIKEAVLAFQLERRYTKDEILKLYLNQVYFGSGAYGVKSAARIFFGKSISDLTLAECALIAGMPKSPARYSPLVNADLAIKRRNRVLKQMAAIDIITQQELSDAIQAPLELASQPSMSPKAAYFVAHVKKQLEEIVGPIQLYKGGLTVHTTLSYSLQKAAEDTVESGMQNLQSRMRQSQIAGDDPQAALVALAVGSGGILSMVGGSNFEKSSFNRATSANRQPGSAFKPIVYACAIERGFAQHHLILDAPIVYKGSRKGKDWQPKNYSESYLGEITLRMALSASQNIPAVRLMEKLGPASVVKFAHTMGIASTLSPNLSLALGTADLTLIELTSAYAAFPNGGQWVEPFGVVEILDRHNRSIYRVKPRKKLVMSRAGAAVMTNMLQAVVKEGTGRRALGLRRPVAGKTGTTNNFKDALFIGFSPTVVAGVWTGTDQFKTLGPGETGARAALPLWIQFMEHTLLNAGESYFDIPDDVIQRTIDPVTGNVTSPTDPNGVLATFKKGTAPGN